MLNQKALEYVDTVISRTAAPEDFKSRLRSELISHIIEASENTDIDEITNILGSPEKLADKISRKLAKRISKELDSIFTDSDDKLTRTTDRICEEYAPVRNHGKYMPQRYPGEYTREESDVNIKLLYIPLIQISSGVEKIHYFLTDECYIN